MVARMRPDALHRRAILGAALSVAAIPPLQSHAAEAAEYVGTSFADESWAVHSGPFTQAFFKDGFKSTDTGFQYKFIQPGDGDKPAKMQVSRIGYGGSRSSLLVGMVGAGICHPRA